MSGKWRGQMWIAIAVSLAGFMLVRFAETNGLWVLGGGLAGVSAWMLWKVAGARAAAMGRWRLLTVWLYLTAMKMGTLAALGALGVAWAAAGLPEDALVGAGKAAETGFSLAGVCWLVWLLGWLLSRGLGQVLRMLDWLTQPSRNA